jgi:hypothetical protein
MKNKSVKESKHTAVLPLATPIAGPFQSVNRPTKPVPPTAAVKKTAPQAKTTRLTKPAKPAAPPETAPSAPRSTETVTSPKNNGNGLIATAAGTRTSTPAAAAAKLTTIEASIDVGFGNALYLRGQGPGLSWDSGIRLTCVDDSTWRWTGMSSEKLTFKLLLNDSVWSQGEDLVVTPGAKLKVAPVF